MDKSTAHFLKQRLTALANIPLALFFLYALMTHADADYETMRTFLSNPLVSAALLGFIVSALWHMYLGMQIIIEDYIHSEALKLFVLALNFLFCLSVGFVSLLSALRIWVG